MRTQAGVLVLALLIVPAGAAAQKGARISHIGAGPIPQLLHQRTELSLTSEQVQKLEAIQQESEVRERALVARLDDSEAPAPAATKSHAGAEVQSRTHAQGGAPSSEAAQLQQLHASQMQRARAILTADQAIRAWGPPHVGKAAIDNAQDLRSHEGSPPGQMRHPRPGQAAPAAVEAPKHTGS